jgi:hypothetical protein
LSKEEALDWESEWYRLVGDSRAVVVPHGNPPRKLRQDANLVVSNPWFPLSRKQRGAWSDGKCVKLVFAGSGYGISELHDLLRRVDQHNQASLWPRVSLDIFSGDVAMKRLLRGRKYVTLRGPVPSDLLPEVLSSYDAGVIPYPVSKELEDVVRWGFASKLGTYLAAGLPTLYIGPSVSETFKFLERTNTGVALEPVTHGLSKAIGKLMSVDYSEIQEAWKKIYSEESMRTAMSVVRRSVQESDDSETIGGRLADRQEDLLGALTKTGLTGTTHRRYLLRRQKVALIRSAGLVGAGELARKLYSVFTRLLRKRSR